MRRILREVIWVSLVLTIGLSVWAGNVATAAAGTEKSEVTALHAAAQACASMVRDAKERSSTLVRLAEVERAAGLGSAQTTLGEAEKAARVVGDKYHLALALCDVARVRQAAGEDPTTLLEDAEAAAEEIEVKTNLWNVVSNEFRARIYLRAARMLPLFCPFTPMPSQSQRIASILGEPSLAKAGATLLTSSPFWPQRFMDRNTTIRLFTDVAYLDAARRYVGEYAAAEAQQRHLRDLALAQVAAVWTGVSPARAVEATQKISDPALRTDTVLLLAQLAAPSGDAESVKLCERALATADTVPRGDERVRARTRAICALLVAAPERAVALLNDLREQIAGVPDAAFRCLMLGDLALAAKTHDDRLAAELYGDAVKSLAQLAAVNPFAALIGALAGAPAQVSPYLGELSDRGFDLLGAGFAIDPARAAEGCETAFRLLETVGKMPGGVPSQAPLAYLQQWGLLRLLAAHDLGREMALAETSGSRLTRAWGLAAAAEAVMGSDPARARDYLDRAWALTEEERKSLIEDFGVDRHGELRVPSIRTISRMGMAEQLRLLNLGSTLTQTVAAQAYLGVLTHRAGGDRALALERCTHSLGMAAMVPRQATTSPSSPAAMLLAQASGIIDAATVYVDREVGKRAAAQLRDRLDASGRAYAAATAAQYLAPVDPVSALEFLTAVVADAPERPTDMLAGIRLMLSDQSVVASLRGAPGYSGASVEDAASRLVSAAKRCPAWMPDVAEVLTEMTLAYSRASAPR